MTWAVTAAIGGSAVLGLLSSDKAADAQGDAARDARGLTMAQYQQNREDLSPWRTSGVSANQRLMEYLGLGGPSGSSVMPTREQFTKTVAATPGGWNGPTQQNMSGFTWTPGSPETSQFDQSGYDAALQGYNSQPTGTPEGYGSLLKPFTGEDLTSEPGYQFGLSEGEKGIERRAMAGSGMNNGATMKALLKFNQDYGGTKYGEAFNRDAANKNSIYGMLSGVSGTGANAAGQTAGLGANAANAAGGYVTNAGDARAAGYVGGANAITGGVGNYLQYQNNQNMAEWLKTLRQPTVGGQGRLYG